MRTALTDHINATQDRAVILHGLLQAIEHLDHDGGCENGLTALITTAKDLARELADLLDSTTVKVITTDTTQAKG